MPVYLLWPKSRPSRAGCTFVAITGNLTITDGRFTMLDGTEHFECDCHSPEHTLRFTLDQEYNEIYTEVFLNQYRPWWKRIWIAVKYVFGYKCMYGHFDCFMMQRADAGRLIALVSQIADTDPMIDRCRAERAALHDDPEESQPDEGS